MNLIRTPERVLENNTVEEIVQSSLAEQKKRQARYMRNSGFKSITQVADVEPSKITNVPKLSVVKKDDFKAVEFAECEIHGEYPSRYSNGDPYQDHAVIRCPRCEREAETKEKLGGVDGVAKRFTLCNFANYQTERTEQDIAKSQVQMYADDFDQHFESGRSMLLYGNVGTGKTHLACAVANQIAARGYVSIFRSVSNLIRSVRETWNGGGNEREVIELYRNVDLLIIDEVGVQNNTENERTILFDILNSRYEEMKPTILITNLDVENFTKAVGLRIASRVQHDGVIVPFTWNDYRKGGV